MSIIMPDFSKSKSGLVAVVVQNCDTKEVLMVAYTKKAQFEETLEMGEAVFFSRSRNHRWKKGETSGNTLKIVSIKIDCDNDALLYIVKPAGPTCHTGERSCFYRNIAGSMLARGSENNTVKILKVHPDITIS